MFDVVLPVLLTGGPGPTAWDVLLPSPVGAAILVAAGAGLIVAVILHTRLSVAGHAEDPPPARGRSGSIAAALLVAAAVLHLALGTMPTAETPRQRRRVLRERAFAHQLLGQTEHARRIRQALRK